MKSVADNWKLLRVLPNIEVPHPFDSLSTQIAVVSYRDARAIAIRALSAGADKLWSGFRDIYGHQLEPSGLICREEFLKNPQGEVAVTSFRNIVALVSTLPAWAYLARDRVPPNPQWSDAWSFCPVEVSTADTLITINPALNVGSSPKTPFAGMPNPLMPLYRDSYVIDWWLFAVLLHAWDDFFLRRRRLTYYRQLFRALEIVMHALALPTYNLTSLYDVGLSLSIWVSAFEVLLHPGSSEGKVNEEQVLTHLKDLKFVKPAMNRVLLSKRYVIQIKRQRQRVSWLERIYHQLYLARNACLHGNPVLTEHWRYDGHHGSVPIGNLAPIVFRTALKLRLGWNLSNAACQVMERGYTKDFVDLVKVSDQLYEDAMTESM